MKRISVDIGGTFTDCFFVWDDKHIEAKALTTHHNLALGFNEALDLACSRADLDREEVLSGVDSVRYATTLGTNALIERKGPKVGALVTHGFEDTIPALAWPRLRRRPRSVHAAKPAGRGAPGTAGPPQAHPIGARAGQLRGQGRGAPRREPRPSGGA